MSDVLPQWAQDIRGAAAGTSQWSFRVAAENDLAFCERLYVMTMRPLLRELQAWEPDIVLPRLRASFESGDTLIIVADGRDVGWMQVVTDPHKFTLTQMHLLPEYRDLGIGSTILTALIALARQSNRQIALSVCKNNRAWALYERFGFHDVGRHGWRIDMMYTPN